MLNTEHKTNINQISLTGVRAITLIGLLIIAPRTLAEIRQAFIDLKIIDQNQSNDVLRIDLNTIKAMGCEISRSSAKTNHKYILEKHPFSLPITMDDVRILKKLYCKLQESVSVEKLLEYNNLLSKIASYIYNPDLKEAFLGISILKNYDLAMLHAIIQYCKDKLHIELAYKKPTSTNIETKHILADRIELNNEKLYLYGYDTQLKKSIMLNARRIHSILSISTPQKKQSLPDFTTQYLLKNTNIDKLTSNEQILKSDNDTYLIEGHYFNKFTAMQRVLSFGASCTILEPEDFRKEIINKLKNMRRIYD